MIRFNIIGKGIIEMPEDNGIGFKKSSPWWRFADVILGRSVEFAVPATDANRALLGFGDDPAEAAMEMRTMQRCQMTYDGGFIDGEIAITAYDGGKFNCVFFAIPEWVSTAQGLKLSDCVCTLNDVVWSTATPVVDADQADWTQVQIVKYDNGIGTQPNWQLAPSVNVQAYIVNLLQNLGVSVLNSGGINTRMWMIAGSLKGRDTDSVTFAQTADDTASVTQSAGLIGLDRVDIDWATARVFGTYVGGGRINADVFIANDDIKITFGTVSVDVFLIRYDFKLNRCECLGGYSSAGEGKDLSGQTIELSRGDRFFFGDRSGNLVNYDIILTGGEYFGWKKLANPLSITATVAVDRDMTLGDTWRVQDNAPDMTLFDFIKGACIAFGAEMLVEGNRVRFMKGRYGIKVTLKPLTDVISIDRVRRNVEAWGNDTRGVTIAFDSDKYVVDKIRSPYYVQNATLDGEKEATAPFSEGNVSSLGVMVNDVKSEGGAYKFDAGKWTLARAAFTGEPNDDYLQRIATPDFEGYSDIADSSTCVKVKVLSPEADFFGLQPETAFVFRGIAYVWTDAEWSAGVMTLTLQKVSQKVTSEKPLPYDAEVEYLESTGTQYIDLGDAPQIGDEFKFDFQNVIFVGNRFVFGARGASSSGRLFISNSSTIMYCNNEISNFTPDLLRHTLQINVINTSSNSNLIIDGVTYNSGAVTTIDSNTYLFTGGGGIISKCMRGRFFNFQQRRGGVLVHDLIPVRVGTVGYMYDRVSGHLYGNDGTGDFVVGPDLP